MFRPIHMFLAVLALGAPLALNAAPAAAQTAATTTAEQGTTAQPRAHRATRHRSTHRAPVRRHHATQARRAPRTTAPQG